MAADCKLRHRTMQAEMSEDEGHSEAESDDDLDDAGDLVCPILIAAELACPSHSTLHEAIF